MFIHRYQWIELYTILKILGITDRSLKKRTFCMLKSVDWRQRRKVNDKKLNGLNLKTLCRVVSSIFENVPKNL